MPLHLSSHDRRLLSGDAGGGTRLGHNRAVAKNPGPSEAVWEAGRTIPFPGESQDSRLELRPDPAD